jgi:hypothetical protein
VGLWSTLTGKDAAKASNEAAADTYRKQTAAVSELKGYGDTLPGAYAGLADRFDPYASAGNSALAQLLSGLGLNGEGGSAEFAQGYRNLPGYQAGLDRGQNAVMGTNAARGMLNSGRTMKDLYRFGSDYEDQRSGDYMNRLAGVAGMGQQATAQGVTTEGAGLQGQLQSRLAGYGGQYGSAGTIGQGMVAGANAQAAGMGNLLNVGANLAGKFLGAGSSGGQGGSGNGNMFPSMSFLTGGLGF